MKTRYAARGARRARSHFSVEVEIETETVDCFSHIVSSYDLIVNGKRLMSGERDRVSQSVAAAIARLKELEGACRAVRLQIEKKGKHHV